jgi:hypothetical protein
VPDNVHQLHVQTTVHVWKTRGCQCSFRLLMMGGVSPKTCWALNKYGIIKFNTYIVASCWSFLYESGIKIFNNLPVNIKKFYNNPRTFKNVLKHFLYMNSFCSFNEYHNNSKKVW